MQGDSSSTSRPGATGASSGAGSSTGTASSGGASTAGATGTGGAGSTGAGGGSASGGRTSGRAAGSTTYGGSYGDTSRGADAYSDTGYDSESDSRLARRRARALDAANGDDRSRTMAFGAGVAVGALLGAGLALLLAPQAGSETRAVIARGARRIPERARDGWDELGEELRSALRRRTKGVRRGMRSARWKAADMMEG